MLKYTTFILLTLTLFSCKDFFEKNLQKEDVTIITPANNSISTNVNITFDWQDVNGALEYRIQIASPTFSNPSSFYMDSTIDVSILALTLSPNEYQWKVRAENNSTVTEYSNIMNLKIDSSYNLSSQSLVLYTPIESLFTNHTILNFTWQDLYSVDTYQFVLKNGTNWNTATTLIDTLLVSANFTNVNNLTEGNYLWSVKGSNTLPSSTNFSQKFNLHIDLTSPNNPNLNLPTSTTTGLLSDSSYLFDWSRASNSGSVQSELFDSLFVYSDTIQTPITKYGSLLEDTLLTLPNTAGTYYWNVKTYDKAGNESTIPYYKSFIVQ